MSTYKSEDYIEAKIAHGQHVFIEKKKIIAFCTYPIHRGVITRAVIKSHDCANKKCRYFRKTNPEYWQAREREHKSQANIHLNNKPKKDIRLEIIAVIQDIAINLGYKIRIENFIEFPLMNKYTIHYTPLCDIEYDFEPLLQDLGMALGKHITLKENLSIWEKAQETANNLNYPICFTGEKKRTEKHDIVYYNATIGNIKDIKKLNTKMLSKFSKPVSLHADPAFLMSHAQTLCNQQKMGINIVSMHYSPDNKQIILVYTPVCKVKLDVAGILSNLYHYSIVFVTEPQYKELEEKYAHHPQQAKPVIIQNEEENAALLEKAQSITEENGYNIVLTLANRKNAQCFNLKYNAMVSELDRLQELSVLISSQTHTTISMQADAAFLLDHLYLLCRKTYPEIIIKLKSHDEEHNIYTFAYSSNKPFINKKDITDSLGKLYRSVIKLTPDE